MSLYTNIKKCIIELFRCNGSDFTLDIKLYKKSTKTNFIIKKNQRCKYNTKSKNNDQIISHYFY